MSGGSGSPKGGGDSEWTGVTQKSRVEWSARIHPGQERTRGRGRGKGRQADTAALKARSKN